MNDEMLVAIICCVDFEDGNMWLRTAPEAATIPSNTKRIFVTDIDKANSLGITEERLKNIEVFTTEAFNNHSDALQILSILMRRPPVEPDKFTGIRIQSDGTKFGTHVFLEDGKEIPDIEELIFMCGPDTDFRPLAVLKVRVTSVDVVGKLCPESNEEKPIE